MKKDLIELLRLHSDNYSLLNFILVCSWNLICFQVFNTPKPLSSHVVIQALKHLEKNSSAIAVKKVFKRYLDYKQFSDHRTSENLNASSTSCDDSDTRTEMCNNRVWTQKYKPCNKQEIIGNSSAVSTLFNWLKRWKIEAEKTIDISERKAKTSDSSDSDSDFEPHQQKSKKSANKVAYDEDDDDDYMCNTMLISGPHGIGKTSSVYALAEELGFKIFEVNVSSKRNGKQVMSHLQEVTQSKQVSNISKNTSDKSNSNIVSFFSKASGKTVSDIEKVQDISSPRLTVEATSLLLFEDIDLVFQEDEGFLNAVSNFMSNTKRPIILTTNDKNYSSLNKLKGDYEELEYLTPPTDVVAQHLQLIALAENMLIRCKDIETLVKYHSGDIRKCILSLQYGITSGGWNQEKAITCSEQSECDVKGSSGESLPKNKSSDMRFNTEVPSLFAPSSCLQTQFGLPFVNTTKELHIKGLMDLTDTLRLYLENHIDLIQSNGIRLINLPKCQIEADSSEKIGESKNITKSGDMPDSSHKCEKCLLNQLDYCNCNNSKKHNSCINQKFLNPLLSFFDNISACDSFLETARNSELEAIGQPVTAGLCTDEITDDISQFWRNDVDIAASIQCHNLFSANQYVKRCMNSVNSNESSFADCKIASFDENQIIVNNSFLEESNLEKNSLLVENEVKRSGSIPLTSYTNIRAKVLDYTPTIRSICRTESHRSEFSNKRSGR
ncbi:ATPase family AAA domain-containing protein 5 [Nymphon striatum]|nr:ATPase family AAA domain-containing protein 5 [Nymphon striatum]